MKNVVPRVAMKDNPLTTSPQTGAAAIMDDTVYTMDDDEVMMGGQVTVYTGVQARVAVPRVQVNIPKRR